MKALSDFIAIILFFVAYAVTKNMVIATAVAVIIGITQAAVTLYKYKKMETMQWVSIVLVVIFGGLTILLEDRTFIMLKSSILPWLMAIIMLVLQLTGKNGIRLLLKKELTLPEKIWNHLSYAWIIFFLALGLLNFAIAYPFTEEQEQIWVNFKLVYIVLTIIFSIAQGIYIMRHLPKEQS